jgi:hypothetical protein
MFFAPWKISVKAVMELYVHQQILVRKSASLLPYSTASGTLNICVASISERLSYYKFKEQRPLLSAIFSLLHDKRIGAKNSLGANLLVKNKKHEHKSYNSIRLRSCGCRSYAASEVRGFYL